MSCWRELGLHLGMSVNLSARNLIDSELPDRSRALLERAWNPRRPADRGGHRERHPGRSRASRSRAERPASRPASLVSIDDFGTGNASIEYLAQPSRERDQDRQILHHRHLRGRARRGHRALDDRSCAPSRLERRGRGHRERGRDRPPRRPGLPHRTGLCHLPAAARGPAHRGCCSTISTWSASRRPLRGDKNGLLAQPAASSRARSSTASIIDSVSLPVNVFCWLGW